MSDLAVAGRRRMGVFRGIETLNRRYLLARSGGLSIALNPEFLRRTAHLTNEREILEVPTEQYWRDTDDDHLRSADRTCRGTPRFRCHFLTGHVISFDEATQRITGGNLIVPQAGA
jgi:hypothetical protein